MQPQIMAKVIEILKTKVNGIAANFFDFISKWNAENGLKINE